MNGVVYKFCGLFVEADKIKMIMVIQYILLKLKMYLFKVIVFKDFSVK